MMFGGRQRQERRDRAAGLVFAWRLPVMRPGALVGAVVVVGGMGLALLMGVRVTVAPAVSSEPQLASLVVVPRSVAGELLLQRAIDAGPYPSRWNPAADPEYVALRRRALKAAREVEVAAAPELRELPEDATLRVESEVPGLELVLPRLPERPEAGEGVPTGGRREVLLGLRVLDGAGRDWRYEPRVVAAEDAREAVGGRYLLEYDEEGRVADVVALTRAWRAEWIEWIAQGRVGRPGGGPGRMSLEIEVAADD